MTCAEHGWEPRRMTELVGDLAVALALVVVAVLVSLRRGLALERDLAVAVTRALVQLFAVAAVIQAVFRHAGLAAGLLVVMLGAAAWTSGSRLRGVPGAVAVAALSIGASSAVGLIVLFGAGVFRFEPRFIVAIGGMLIGNCMTATSLAGSRLRDELTDKVHEIEARLALGVPAREALTGYVRRSAATALVPTIDQTKNVGLIVLPGTFVGMIIAGASPVAAAKVQLIVLFMLLGVAAVCALLATSLVARAFIAPGDRIVLPPALRT